MQPIVFVVLWLGQVPIYSVIFLKITILSSFIYIFLTVTNSAIHATGDIRRISYINGSLFLLTPLISYTLFKFNFPAWSIYVVSLIVNVIVCACSIGFIKIQIPQIRMRVLITIIAKIYLCVLFSFSVVAAINDRLFTGISSVNCSLIQSLLHIATISLIGLSLVSLIAMVFIVTRNERQFIIRKLRYIFSFCSIRHEKLLIK